MNSPNPLRCYAVHVFALAVLAILYGFARLPYIPEGDRAALAASFKFKRVTLPELGGFPPRYVRDVHPSLEHMKGWISTVGASIALNDIDGDGLSNDLCYVNVRTDQVLVLPAPGTPDRYDMFELGPAPLPYDSKTMAPMGCLPGDVNEDGLMDIIVYYWGRTPIAFLRRADAPGQAIGRNAYSPCEIAPEGGRWFTNAATLADIDGDGHLDLIVGNYFPDGSRILDAKADGKQTLHDSMSLAFNGGRNRLLLWKSAARGTAPSVRFEDHTAALPDEVAHGWTLAAGATDLDGDLLPEIYFANDFGPDRLLHNRSTPGKLLFALLEGERAFTTPKSKVLGRDSFKGMGVDFGDLNGDGLPDILVSNIASEFALEESHFAFMSTGQTDRIKKGVAPYVDQSESLGLSRSGWGWDIKMADFNNDGSLEVVQAVGFMKGKVNRWPELHEVAMGNDNLLSKPESWHKFQRGDDLGGHLHNPFYVRAADHRYYDLAPEIGIDQPQVSRGIATADVNGDGALDFATGNQWEFCNLFLNESSRAGSFLGLRLLLPLDPDRVFESRAGIVPAGTPSRPAVGASATVRLPDGRRFTAQVDGGNGHSGKRSHELHFGLGNLSRDSRLEVEIKWRAANGQVRSQMLQLAPGWHTVLLGQQ